MPAARRYPGGEYRVPRRRSDGTAYRHTGLDLWAPRGTPVLAPERGRVIWARDTPGGVGLAVLVSAPQSGQTWAAEHLDAIAVREGQTVRRGQTIGTVGDTRGGGARFARDSPHLHLERLEGAPARLRAATVRRDPAEGLQALGWGLPPAPPSRAA